MNFEIELKKTIKDRYGSVAAFSKAIDVPYSTIDNIFKRGIMGVSIQVVLKVCSELHIDIEKIPEDKLTFKTSCIENLTEMEQKLIEIYNQLNPIGKAKTDEYVQDLAANPKYVKSDKYKEEDTEDVSTQFEIAAYGGGIMQDPDDEFKTTL